MKIEILLWCNDEKANADKVWGVIHLHKITDFPRVNQYATFWGRRGKKLQTKVWQGGPYEVSILADKKVDRGYQWVDVDNMSTLYPEFQEDLEKTAVWALLKA